MNTEMLKLASFFAARTDTRWYLNSVYVTPTCIVASDGHRMVKIACNIELPDNIPLILDINDVMRFIKSIPKKLQDKPVTITKIDSMCAKLESCGQSSMIKVLSGEYPDYNRVIPAENITCTGKWQHFNWTYLAGAQKAYADYVGKKDTITIPFKMRESNNAYFNDENGIEMVIMPVRT